jgi:hypothetical protein
MSNPAKLALAAAGAAVALVLFFVLRPNDESAAPTTPTDTSGTPTVIVDGEATPPTTTLEPEGPQPVRITFEGGEVTGPRRAEFTVGDRVIVVVRADVVDLMEDMAPNSLARFSFRADAPGQFEVELEDRHLSLTELIVSP